MAKYWILPGSESFHSSLQDKELVEMIEEAVAEASAMPTEDDAANSETTIDAEPNPSESDSV